MVYKELIIETPEAEIDARCAALAELGISSYIYRMLPYVITLIVLAFTSRKSRAPKAEGIPYDKGAR